MPEFAGLTEAEARRRLGEYGANELPRSEGRTIPRIALETIREPMFMLLCGAAVLYLGLGDLGEGLLLLAGAAASVGLVIVQEARSERALKALRELAAPQVRVIRDAAERTIPSRDLVPGDLVLVSEGERLHADALLIDGEALFVDEAALSGESAPVTKRPARQGEGFAEARLGSDGAPDLFSGTLVVRGQGLAAVSRTGGSTSLGRIGALLAHTHEEPTPLQRSSRRLITWMGSLAAACCTAIVLAYGLLRHDWIAGALAGVTAAMSLVPEEFAMVLTVFMALGAWRLANHKVLVRRNAVIEALGGATILCVDKTGTLTQNRMAVSRVWTGEDDHILAETDLSAAAGVLAAAKLACGVRSIDPMDLAIMRCCGLLADDVEATAVLERAWPLQPERLAVVQLWRRRDGAALGAAKGAPEAVIHLCGLSEAAAHRLRAQVQSYAERGLRVLAVAQGWISGPAPAEPESIAFELVGLLAFEDPLRPEAQPALREARGAGIKVLMITGDHPATALAIAGAVGIDTQAGCLLGRDVAELAPASLRERLQTVRVLARVSPEQKLLVVEALKANGELVAMTGDGVNDAPALEAAHIGIAMGRRGTDVAREAADLVLLDDSFASIVGGVRLGRRISNNLRRALTFIVAVHVPIAGLALAPPFLGVPALLWPMHVMLLELAIDPTCALVFENEPSERRAMSRPPRNPKETLFASRQMSWAVLQGGVVLAAVFGFYQWTLASTSEEQARGLGYMALIVAVLALALAESISPGARLLARHRWPIALISAAAGGALLAILTIPALERLFDVSTPPLPYALAALLTGGVAGAWFGPLRRLPRTENRSTHANSPAPGGGC